MHRSSNDYIKFFIFIKIYVIIRFKRCMWGVCGSITMFTLCPSNGEASGIFKSQLNAQYTYC